MPEAPDDGAAAGGSGGEGAAMDAEDIEVKPDSGWQAEAADDGGWSHAAGDGAAAQRAGGAEAGTSKSARAGRRMRRRGGDNEAPAAGADAKGEERGQAPTGVKREEDEMMLFEGQKRLGRGLCEALVMVRERGWLYGVEYRGRQSDFKGNQQQQVRNWQPLLKLVFLSAASVLQAADDTLLCIFARNTLLCRSGEMELAL